MKYQEPWSAVGRLRSKCFQSFPRAVFKNDGGFRRLANLTVFALIVFAISGSVPLIGVTWMVPTSLGLGSAIPSACGDQRGAAFLIDGTAFSQRCHHQRAAVHCVATPTALDGTEALVNIAVNLALLVAIAMFVPQLQKKELIPDVDCLPGRKSPIDGAPGSSATHQWLGGRPISPPFPQDTQMIMFGMGCFWCSENLFMRLPKGIYSTAVGYSGGITPNPTYDEVCSGNTNHAEVVRVVYKPNEISCEELMQRFWEGHDPTTANQQGNDVGTPYRSALYYYTEEQKALAEKTREQFQALLRGRGVDAQITTEIKAATDFYYAEDYHQQYDARGNAGYCGLRPTGARFSS